MAKKASKARKAVLETEVQETGVQETEVQETEVQETGVQETEVQETGVPEAEIPETGVPEAEIPETGVPEAGVPEAEIPETGVPEAKKRGRKKGWRKPTEPKNENKHVLTEDFWNEGAKVVHDEKTQENEQEAIKTEEKQAPLISGYILLILLDFLGSNIFAFGYKYFTKESINPEKLRLSKSERKELETLAEESAKYINLRMNPLAALSLCLVSIYFSKIGEAKKEAPKKNKTKQTSLFDE